MLAFSRKTGKSYISLATQQKNFEIAGNLITTSTYFTQLGYEFRKRSQIFDVAFAYNPNGVKLETLPGGFNKFNFQNKPDILIADDTAGNLNLTIDPTITYSVTGGKGNDRFAIMAISITGGILNGGAGDDTLTGAKGSDIINGGKGKDIIKGGAGDDTITIDEDDILTSLDGGEGFDIVTIDSDSRFNLILKDINNIESIIGNKVSNQITYDGVKQILISGDLGNDIITGGEGDDQIEGGEGKDKLYGNKGNDLLLGGLDDDSLYGEQNDDQLYGQEGDDFLDSGDGNNILDGGIGNDSLQGGYGQNTYVFGRNYGIDTLIENSNTGTDILKFKAGISRSDIIFWRKQNSSSEVNNLYLAIKNTNDRLIIQGHFKGNTYGIDQFIFADGTTVTRSDINSLSLPDNIPEDNLLNGDNNPNTLDGGLGNDTLAGGTENDTYIFKQGYGQDIIQEDYYGLNSYYDTVKFGAGLTTNTMEIVRQGNDLIFKVKGSSDRLTIKDQFDYPFEAISVEEFQFDNGATVWTKENIKQYLLKSTTGDDYIVGYSDGTNNETLDGGLGNDTLAGGTGNDTYIFKQGYGQDIIQEAYYGFNSYYDTVKFGAGLTTNTMEIIRQDNDLVFKVKGSSDRLTIKDQFGYPSDALSVEEFQFDNGAVIWTKEDIKQYLLKSTDGDDYIVGYFWGINNEILDGGLGNDTLAGGTGNDTYIFKHGYGQDIIQEAYYGFNSYYDTVKFGRGLTPQTMEIVRQDNDLIFKIKNNTDRLTIKNQFDYPGEVLSVEEFQFDNGAIIWTKEDIKNYLASTLNNAPIVTNPIIDQTTGSNSPFNFIIPANTFSDTNIGDSLSYTVTKGDGSSLPSWLKFNSITRTFIGTPALTDVGILNIKVIATDNSKATVSDVFAINIRKLTGTAGNDSITGTLNDDKIEGLGGNDTLFGLAGNDTLDGGTGQDTMTGGLDNDTYIVDDSADKVVENANQGTDTIRSSISYTLGENLENLILTGTSNLSGTGNTLNNLITGNSVNNTLNGKAGDDIINGEDGDDTLKGELGNDTLNGGAGNDTLDGGAGNDVMIGGAGNDIYYTDSSNDQITEVFNEGTDTVSSAITWTLGNNLENLIFTGSNAINGTGNGLKNSITGNTANNTLLGGDNDDTLKGNAGNDTLNGGAGNDVMIGGAGNDIYYTDSTNDQITEVVNEGTDTVSSAITWTLGNNLENLILTGSNGINGTGNALNNNITGNSANNNLSGGDNNDTLNGGDGNDTLIGGTGNDILIGGRGSDLLTGGTGNDKFVYNSLGEGIDTISDFNSTVDVIVVQTLLTSLKYTGINPITDGYIRGIQSGLNTLIQIDADGVAGSASFSTLITLSNFNASNFSQNNLIF
ncbi:MAG: calcium-binding protein [Nostoc sp. EkiNYC01]|nr:calcium-binding protein [Nostoc sp. EkiNYC01]